MQGRPAEVQGTEAVQGLQNMEQDTEEIPDNTEADTGRHSEPEPPKRRRQLPDTSFFSIGTDAISAYAK